MSDPTESDLAAAKAAVGTLLEEMKLSAHLYAVEPRDGQWAVIVECATDSGWQRAELRAGVELLDAVRGDAAAHTAVLADWRTHLGDCSTD